MCCMSYLLVREILALEGVKEGLFAPNPQNELLS